MRLRGGEAGSGPELRENLGGFDLEVSRGVDIILDAFQHQGALFDRKILGGLQVCGKGIDARLDHQVSGDLGLVQSGEIYRLLRGTRIFRASAHQVIHILSQGFGPVPRP